MMAAAATLLFSAGARAQYYSWGSDAASLRWSAIEGECNKAVFPDMAQGQARRLLHYADFIHPYIGFGFSRPAEKMPFVIHPENFRSNGLVMYMPKRTEILSTPDAASYSMPWLKQLAAHECRHAVQYGNLNRGVIRALSYIIGQQGSVAGLLFLPLWAIEGDAVMSETQMSSFGRGMQPSFSMEYRAMGNIMEQRRNVDKWFCGSYRDNVPDHYHIGYQIASYAYTKYGCNIWDSVARYASRNPYVFATTAVALKKYYGTSVKRLACETFADLTAFWDAMPAEKDSSQPVPQPVPPRSYTRYEHPMPLGDSAVLALKTDMSRPTRIVTTRLDNGRERHRAYTGSVSTRPVYDPQSGRVWWSEYRRSLLFAEKVDSRICVLDAGRRRPRTLRKYRNALYPTPLAPDTLAWVEYEPQGVWSIVTGNESERFSRLTLPPFTEIHGLAYDSLTGRLCFITTDDEGMRIGAAHVTDGRAEGGTEWLTQPAYITLSSLTANNGILFFGSIESGKDEVHALDLADMRQYRLTTSEYGSFDGTAAGGRLVMTTYDRNGYHLAVQPAEMQRIPVEQGRLPRNTVNPPRAKWDVPNLDTVRFTPAAEELSRRQFRSRRYCKALHLFNIHSWAPVSYNPFNLLDEGSVPDVNLGATVVSQNLLSNSEMYLSYGWNRAQGSVLRGAWTYYGLGVNLSLSASWGGEQMVYTAGMYNPETDEVEIPRTPALKKSCSVSAAASLPMVFQSGYHTQYLTLSAAWNYSNALRARVNRLYYGGPGVSNLQRIGYDTGVHTLQFGVTFYDAVRLAYRDFAPRFGVMVSASSMVNAQTRSFGSLLSTYALLYLPGAAPHNSLSLSASYQTSLGGFSRKGMVSNMYYKAVRLLPKGYNLMQINNKNYTAAAINYQLPLCYPDGGIPSVIYFKRIRLNAGFCYAGFDRTITDTSSWKSTVRREHIFSGGVDAILDINLFRLPAAATTTFTLSAYVTREGKPFFSAGLGMPF